MKLCLSSECMEKLTRDEAHTIDGANLRKLGDLVSKNTASSKTQTDNV